MLKEDEIILRDIRKIFLNATSTDNAPKAACAHAIGRCSADQTNHLMPIVIEDSMTLLWFEALVHAGAIFK